MFTNSIIESLYLFKALYVNHQISKFITDTPLISQLLFLTFSYYFFMKILTIKDFSRSNFHKDNSSPVNFAKWIMVTFIGLSILSSTKKTSIYDYQKYNWKRSSLLQSQVKGNKDANYQTYEVSTILYYLMKVVSNIEFVTTSFIDKTFNPTDKYSRTPNGLYRTFISAGYSQITDTALRAKLAYYQKQCLNPLIAQIQNKKDIENIIDNSLTPRFQNRKLKEIFRSKVLPDGSNCLKFKKEINKDIKKHLNIRGSNSSYEKYRHHLRKVSKNNYENFVISNNLSNFFNQKSELSLIEKEARLDGASGFFQYIQSSWFVSLFSEIGSASAANSANLFSEAIKVGPHIKGFFLLILIGSFPILVFFIIAFGLKPLKLWLISYFLISMWMPLWALLYSVNISFFKNSDAIIQLQQFSDGISYHAARVIKSQTLRSYSVFFAGQVGLIVVTLFGLMKNFGQTFASDKSKDEAPSELKAGVSTGAKFTSGGLM